MIRKKLLNVVESKFFEAFIIISILISSLLLTFNDVYLKNGSLASKFLVAFDYLFRLIFLIEMLMKWIAFGLKKFFSDWWCILDFMIVLVSKLLLRVSSISKDLFLLGFYNRFRFYSQSK